MKLNFFRNFDIICEFFFLKNCTFVVKIISMATNVLAVDESCSVDLCSCQSGWQAARCKEFGGNSLHVEDFKTTNNYHCCDCQRCPNLNFLVDGSIIHLEKTLRLYMEVLSFTLLKILYGLVSLK